MLIQGPFTKIIIKITIKESFLMSFSTMTGQELWYQTRTLLHQLTMVQVKIFTILHHIKSKKRKLNKSILLVNFQNIHLTMKRIIKIIDFRSIQVTNSQVHKMNSNNNIIILKKQEMFINLKSFHIKVLLKEKEWHQNLTMRLRQ